MEEAVRDESATQTGALASGVEAVHDRVRDAILRGELRPGATISQVQLARELGVSRTPLREALRMLQHEGLVAAEPNRRVHIAPFSVADLEELYVARLALEAAAVRVTVVRTTPEEVAHMEGVYAQLVHFARERDYERWETVHRELHHRLVAHAGDRLVAMLGQLSDHAERYRRLRTTQVPRAWTEGAREHRLIVDAAQAGDADLCARRVVAHLARTARSVVAMAGAERRLARLDEVQAAIAGDGDPWAA